jgi:hypothetical protein
MKKDEREREREVVGGVCMCGCYLGEPVGQHKTASVV